MSDNPLRDFYKTLSGRGALPLEPDDPYYEPILQANRAKDPILQLRERIDWAESESVDLLTGFRGNGKSTELRRLKKLLEERNCTVFLINMLDYVLMTKPVEIGDFIISAMAALAHEAGETTGLDTITESYWERLGNFLTAEVEIDGLNLNWKAPGAAAKLGLRLKSEPSFKQRLQAALRGHITALVEDARAYVVELVGAIRSHSGDPDRKVVLLVDSMEQLRGVGAEAEAVHRSVVELFSGQAANLEFRQLHLVYTIPPYLIPLAPNTARNLGGHPISTWPNIHVRTRYGDPDADGLGVMEHIIHRRYADWGSIFEREQLQRLATVSGGDLRDFFRLVREALLATSTSGRVDRKVRDTTLDQVESQLRGEFLPIAKDDARWLARVSRDKNTALESTEDLPRLARFFDGNLIMNYLNGEPWYDIHPVLRDEVAREPGPKVS